jgi:type IX secretion system substrate protein/SprB-like repeat protein
MNLKFSNIHLFISTILIITLSLGFKFESLNAMTVSETSNENSTFNLLDNNLTGDISSTAITCFAGNDGTATANISGGTEPYSYDWSTGSEGMMINNLSAGVYTVTVTDATSCTLILSVTLVQPNQILISSSVTNPSCAGLCDGMVNLNIIGGNAPFQFSWSGPCTGQNPVDICPGTFSVTVTDATGCTSNHTVTLNSPTPLELSMSATGETNINLNDGTATGIPSGGTSPYTYLWNDPNNQTTQTATNLAPGDYCVTITDNNGCTIIDCITISSFSCDITLEVSSGNVSCFGACDATIDLTVNGGTAPFTYNWNPISAGNNQDPTNLCPGGYQVTVTDANQCTASINTFVSGNSQINGDLTYFLQSCAPTCNDSINTIITGGTLPYQYLWSNGDTIANPGGLCQGNYSLTVTDAVGCSEVFVPLEIILPPALEANIETIDANCFGVCDGSLSATITGGFPPYTYDWDVDIFDGQDTATDLCAGNYILVVGDASGCSVFLSGSVNEPTELLVATATTNACFGECNGTVVISVTGGVGPYTYSWEGDPQMLCPGTYNVTVTDANGCSKLDDYTVFENTEMTYTLDTLINEMETMGDGAISITANGGTPGYTYNWLLNNISVSTMEDPTDLSGGIYICEISDAFGCMVTTDEIVVDNIVNTYEAAWANKIKIFPNPVNEMLFIQYDLNEPLQVNIEMYDIRGVRVLQQKSNTNNFENDQLNLSHLPNGVYTLSIGSEESFVTYKIVKMDR